MPRETLAEEWDDAAMPAYPPARYGSVQAGGIENGGPFLDCYRFVVDGEFKSLHQTACPCARAEAMGQTPAGQFL